jgi:hypothetical protein
LKTSALLRREREYMRGSVRYMKENKVYSKFVAFFIIVTIIVSAFGAFPQMEKSEFSEENDLNPDLQTREKRGTRASSPRTVLAEYFTNWGCGRCDDTGPAIHELMDVFSPSELVTIEYHIYGPSSTDPFYLYNEADSDARVDYYSINSVPRLYVDGPPVLWKGSGTSRDTYLRWKDEISDELNELSNATISLEGYLDQISLSGTINATIEVTDPLPSGTLKIRFAVVEDNLYAPGPNGEARHRNVMRDMLTDEPLPLLNVGDTYDVSRTFPLDANLNWESISIVVFIQNDDDKDVLQSASYDFIPQDILVIDDDESSNPIGYEDDYHEILTELEYAFDGWVLNERGSPLSQDLENYDAVIWITATTSSSTLTATDQNTISEYLDNGRGSVFISGENVGSDIGQTAFYQNYLHSTFITDYVGEFDISGISGDPISDPFFGTAIPIFASSPSEISPINPASLVFTYSPSGDPGGIKAVHDYDSKVVYFDFMYFEGSDSDINKMILMERILNWMMDLSYAIPLSEGWNLISIPLIQSDTQINTVLESIDGDYDSIQWFDSSDILDPWKHNINGKPFGNDLSDITHELAFWVYITKPGGTELSCKGIAPTIGQSIDLHKGWNLVGYPSLINRDRNTALNNIAYGSDVDAVWTYNAASNQWTKLQSSDQFTLSRGYWIHSLVEKTWDVPL